MALRDFPHLLVDSSRAMSLILFNETNTYDVVSVLGLGRSDGVERAVGHAERTFINRILLAVIPLLSEYLHCWEQSE
jgi:hypothetical protein